MKILIRPNSWRFIQPAGSVDCGIFVCWYAEQLSKGLPIDKTYDKELNSYRAKIAPVIRSSVVLGMACLNREENEHRLFENKIKPGQIPLPNKKQNGLPRVNDVSKGIIPKSTYYRNCNIDGNKNPYPELLDPLFESLIDDQNGLY